MLLNVSDTENKTDFTPSVIKLFDTNLYLQETSSDLYTSNLFSCVTKPKLNF